MKLFKNKTPLSALADDDLAAMLTQHQSNVHRLQDYRNGTERRSAKGLIAGVIGSMASIGLLAPVAAGVLSIAVLPVALPITVMAAGAGLTAMVAAKIGDVRASRQEEREIGQIAQVVNEAQQRNAPGLKDMLQRLDRHIAYRADVDTPAPAVRAKGLRLA